MEHIRNHIKDIDFNELVMCPHPLCDDYNLASVEDLEDHFLQYHGISDQHNNGSTLSLRLKADPLKNPMAIHKKRKLADSIEEPTKELKTVETSKVQDDRPMKRQKDNMEEFRDDPEYDEEWILTDPALLDINKVTEDWKILD